MGYVMLLSSTVGTVVERRPQRKKRSVQFFLWDGNEKSLHRLLCSVKRRIECNYKDEETKGLWN